MKPINTAASAFRRLRDRLLALRSRGPLVDSPKVRGSENADELLLVVPGARTGDFWNPASSAQLSQRVASPFADLF